MRFAYLVRFFYSILLLFKNLSIALFSNVDFDGDDMLGENDLRQVVERLIGEHNHLPDNDMKQLIQVIIQLVNLWTETKFWKKV